MTREEALAGHRRLWNEIADMIERGVQEDYGLLYKVTALENLGEKRAIKGGCYLCEYADKYESVMRIWDCAFDCIVRWRGLSCGHPKSEYKSFERAVLVKDYTQAAILARKIANLPERVVE